MATELERPKRGPPHNAAMDWARPSLWPPAVPTPALLWPLLLVVRLSCTSVCPGSVSVRPSRRGLIRSSHLLCPDLVSAVSQESSGRKVPVLAASGPREGEQRLLPWRVPPCSLGAHPPSPSSRVSDSLALSPGRPTSPWKVAHLRAGFPAVALGRPHILVWGFHAAPVGGSLTASGFRQARGRQSLQAGVSVLGGEMFL